MKQYTGFVPEVTILFLSDATIRHSGLRPARQGSGGSPNIIAHSSSVRFQCLAGQNVPSCVTLFCSTNEVRFNLLTVCHRVLRASRRQCYCIFGPRDLQMRLRFGWKSNARCPRTVGNGVVKETKFRLPSTSRNTDNVCDRPILTVARVRIGERIHVKNILYTKFIRKRSNDRIGGSSAPGAKSKARESSVSERLPSWTTTEVVPPASLHSRHASGKILFVSPTKKNNERQESGVHYRNSVIVCKLALFIYVTYVIFWRFIDEDVRSQTQYKFFIDII